MDIDRTDPTTNLFLPVKLFTLKVGDILGFELYLRQESTNVVKHILYKGRQTQFSGEKRDFLIENGIDTLYIRKSDDEVYWKYVSTNIEELLVGAEITVDEKSRLIYDASSAVVERMFSDPTSIVHHERAESLVQSTVEFLTADQWNFHSLLRMLSYDYTTYTHCVNVCAMGIALARSIGFDKEDELNSIGLGLLMHDLGKSKISHAILNKRSMLSSTEMAEIRRHPLYGIELLRLNPRVRNLSREIVLHHHEKINGTGYPHGLRDAEIPMITRVATIVDVFDALTTRRPYKKALRAYPALRIMRDEMPKEIDPSILRSLISILAPKSKKVVSIA